VAVVVPNVIGLIGRGGKQAHDEDEGVVQLATAAFYSDVHAGWVDSDNRWANVSHTPGHYLPTAIGWAARHVLVLNRSEDSIEPITGNPRIDLDESGANPAQDCDIEAHAIWIGLLTNAPGETGSPDASDRDAVAPLLYEHGSYLQEIPESAMAESGGHDFNGAPNPGGTYCWVVGKRGTVYGAYKAAWDGNWYAGFSQGYP
jgi:hypothetical protein